MGRTSLAIALLMPLALAVALPAPSGRGAEAQERKLPPEWTPLAGQQKTCAGGPRHRTFNIPAVEKTITLGMDMKITTWTFAGVVPGPVIEVCQGDTVTLKMPNEDKVAHGLDTHAFKVDAEKYGPVGPGERLTLTKIADTPGVFMYHCAAGPLTDDHIKAGMYGAMIVHPRDAQFRPARELVVVQGALFGGPGAGGLVSSSPERRLANNPFTLLFNGRLEHEPVRVKPGELVRVYFVNAGPGTSAVHVIGAILDRFHAGGNPKNALYGVQTENVPAGGGAIFEFRVPEKGKYLLVDHDNLRFIPMGFAIPIVAQDAAAARR